MAVALALVSAMWVYSVTGLVFQGLYGAPRRPGALQRELERISGENPEADQRRWKRRLEQFLTPPEAWNPTAFHRQLAFVAVAGFAVGALIFRSILTGIPMALVVIPFRYYWVAVLRRQRKDLLNLQFKDALFAISASLRAGASLPTAVERSHEDLQRILRGQPHQPMVEEIGRMIREMQFGGSVEDALIRFRDRAGLEDATNFVNATLLCKTRGGNLADVLATIAQIVGEKVSVKRQIQVLTAGKRMEANLLTSVPPVLVVALGTSSPEYMAPLFTTLFGQILSLLGVTLLVAAFVIGRKVVEIEV